MEVMQAITFDNPAAAQPLPIAGQRTAPGFASSLSATMLDRGDAPRDEQNAQHTAPEEAREAAEQLVASAFLQPMFKQLRESGFKTGLFDGGQAEQAFEQRLHTRIGDRLVRKMDLPMVDAVTRYLTQNGSRGGQTSTAQPASAGAMSAGAGIGIGMEVNRHG